MMDWLRFSLSRHRPADKTSYSDSTKQIHRLGLWWSIWHLIGQMFSGKTEKIRGRNQAVMKIVISHCPHYIKKDVFWHGCSYFIQIIKPGESLIYIQALKELLVIWHCLWDWKWIWPLLPESHMFSIYVLYITHPVISVLLHIKETRWQRFSVDGPATFLLESECVLMFTVEGKKAQCQQLGDYWHQHQTDRQYFMFPAIL